MCDMCHFVCVCVHVNCTPRCVCTVLFTRVMCISVVLFSALNMMSKHCVQQEHKQCNFPTYISITDQSAFCPWIWNISWPHFFKALSVLKMSGSGFGFEGEIQDGRTSVFFWVSESVPWGFEKESWLNLFKELLCQMQLVFASLFVSCLVETAQDVWISSVVIHYQCSCVVCFWRSVSLCRCGGCQVVTVLYL